MAYGRKVFWHTILAAEIAPVCYRDTEIVNLSAVRINHIIKPTFLKILLQLYQRCSPKYICKETLQLEAILPEQRFCNGRRNTYEKIKNLSLHIVDITYILIFIKFNFQVGPCHM